MLTSYTTPEEENILYPRKSVQYIKNVNKVFRIPVVSVRFDCLHRLLVPDPVSC